MMRTLARGCWLVFCAPLSAATVYVDADAVGGNNGTSWADAYNSISAALAAASMDDEIWVAEGTYGPISLVNGVKVYGGFFGDETSSAESDPVGYPTIISGGSHTVMSDSNDASAILRGFRIQNGIADVFPNGGGGFYLYNSSPLIADCIFTSNNSSSVGGAVANYGIGSPTFANCTFSNNHADIGGGAVFNRKGSPTFVNCLFYGNDANDGGAVGNTFGAPSFCNCTFSNNTATQGMGGALYDYVGGATLENCIVWNNQAGGPAKEILNGPSATTTVTYSNVNGGFSGEGNLNADPMFVDPAGGDFRLLLGSPCRDAGINDALPPDQSDLDWDTDIAEPVPLDLELFYRVDIATVDMGAYEIPCSAAQSPLPDPDLPDVGNGTANRYIPLVPLNKNMITALRVTLTNLPSPFTSFNGTTMWVAAPQETCENSSQTTPPQGGCGPAGGGPLTFMASRLTCDPVYMDWGAVGLIYVYDDEIVPGATYTVQAIYQGCDAADETQYSAPMSISTSQNWGDVTGDCSGSPCTPPDGIVDIVDVSAIQDKSVNIIDLPKARADLDPDVPNRKVDIMDVVRAVDATGGAPYPFDGPAECQQGGGGPPKPPPIGG